MSGDEGSRSTKEGLVFRAISEPIRSALTPWEEVWKREDRGLIACWERGRVRAKNDPDASTLAKAGALPVLTYKGGITPGTSLKKKHGSLEYLAMWQGLRLEDLDIDLNAERQLTCSRTGVKVTFTGNIAKLLGDE